jgi:hypothetical protein
MIWRSKGTAAPVAAVVAGVPAGLIASIRTLQLPLRSNGLGTGSVWTMEINPESLSFTMGCPPPGGVTVKRKSPKLLGHIRLNSTSRLVVEIGTLAEYGAFLETNLTVS